MRDPNRIPNVLDAVRRAWETVPDWRLGQLICNIGRYMGKYDPFFIEDEDLVRYIEQCEKEEQ